MAGTRATQHHHYMSTALSSYFEHSFSRELLVAGHPNLHMHVCPACRISTVSNAGCDDDPTHRQPSEGEHGQAQSGLRPQLATIQVTASVRHSAPGA